MSLSSRLAGLGPRVEVGDAVEEPRLGVAAEIPREDVVLREPTHTFHAAARALRPAAGMGHTIYSLKGEVDRSGSSRSARTAANACATQGRSSSPPSFLSTHENSKGIVVARYFTVAVSSATWRLRSRTSWRAQSSLAAAMVSATLRPDCADLIECVIQTRNCRVRYYDA